MSTQQAYLWEEPGQRTRSPRGLVIGIMLAAHAGLIGWIYQTRIATAVPPVESDHAVSVALQKNQTPPPPPRAVRKAPPLVHPLTPHVSPVVVEGASLSPVPATPELPSAPEDLHAAPEPQKPASVHLITRPSWAKAPDGAVFSTFYPDRAARRGKEGAVTLSCMVTAQGVLNTCTVVSEAPGDYGFGDASLKIARFFRMKPQELDGQPVEGGQVNVQIRWKLPE